MQTLVEVKVSGLISRTRSDSYAVWHGALGTSIAPLDPGGEYIWGGYSQCFGNVTVLFTKDDGTNGGGVMFCDTYNYIALTATWQDTIPVIGIGSASRTRSWVQGNWIPCQPDCYVYSGSQTISVTPVPATLKVVASQTVAPPGTTITFDATATTLDGKNAPLDVTSWSWQPDSGESVTCAAHSPSCGVTVYSSGTLRAVGLANGSEQTRTVGVLVTLCPTGDSLLDTKAMHDALKGLWNAADASDPNTANRREQAGFLWQDATTGEWGSTLNINAPGNDACDSHAGSAGVADSEVRAFIHVHPFAPYERLPMTNCPGREGGLYAPGPSGADVSFLKSAQASNPSVAGYLMDAANVYAFDASGHVTPYPRKVGSCVRY